jgi:hypothetical protein
MRLLIAVVLMILNLTSCNDIHKYGERYQNVKSFNSKVYRTVPLVYNYKDYLHSYKVFVDTTPCAERNYSYEVKIISVYTRDNNTLLQTIIPPHNGFWHEMNPREIFILEDMNFDGFNDIRIIQFTGPPNISYYCWTFNNVSKQFQRDTTLEIITNPEFDQRRKIITSWWSATLAQSGSGTYQWIDSKITLIAEEEQSPAYDMAAAYKITKKKRINGTMGVVSETFGKF